MTIFKPQSDPVLGVWIASLSAGRQAEKTGSFSFSLSALGVDGMEGDVPKVSLSPAREGLTCLDLLSTRSALCSQHIYIVSTERMCWF